jgi:hypothetical protein
MRVREVSGSRWEISLRTGGRRFVRYALRDPTDWRKGRSPFAQCNRATEEQKREGWERAVRIEKISAAVLDEAHKRQVEETIETLAEGPDGFYKSYLDLLSWFSRLLLAVKTSFLDAFEH